MTGDGLVHAGEVLRHVRGRLVAQDALTDLVIFDGLSLDELELLVRREAGLGSPDCSQDFRGTVAA